MNIPRLLIGGHVAGILCSLGHFFGRKFALLWSIDGFFPVLSGTLAGAAIYREEPVAA